MKSNSTHTQLWTYIINARVVNNHEVIVSGMDWRRHAHPTGAVQILEHVPALPSLPHVPQQWWVFRFKGLLQCSASNNLGNRDVGMGLVVCAEYLVAQSTVLLYSDIVSDANDNVHRLHDVVTCSPQSDTNSVETASRQSVSRQSVSRQSVSRQAACHVAGKFIREMTLRSERVLQYLKQYSINR